MLIGIVSPTSNIEWKLQIAELSCLHAKHVCLALQQMSFVHTHTQARVSKGEEWKNVASSWQTSSTLALTQKSLYHHSWGFCSGLRGFPWKILQGSGSVCVCVYARPCAHFERKGQVLVLLNKIIKIKIVWRKEQNRRQLGYVLGWNPPPTPNPQWRIMVKNGMLSLKWWLVCHWSSCR